MTEFTDLTREPEGKATNMRLRHKTSQRRR